MADPLTIAMKVAGSGLQAQTQRMQIVSQNIANAGVTGTQPGEDPYVRKTVSFVELVDRESGVSKVQIGEIGVDDAPFTLRHDPSHIAADENGMVKMSNVNTLTEMTDMRETIRFYQANLQTVKQARNLISMTLDMMRG